METNIMVELSKFRLRLLMERMLYPSVTVDQCVPNPCLNDGVCTEGTCNCDGTGFTGEFCEIGELHFFTV